MLKRISNKNFITAFAHKFHKRGALNSPILRNFFASMNQGRPNNGNYSAIVTRRDTTIASSFRWEDSSTIEDRFQLSKIFDVKKIFLILISKLLIKTFLI